MDFEVHLTDQPQEKWAVAGFGERGGQRMGSVLIIQASQKEVSDALAGKVTLDTLPAWFQGHLKAKGFVGITLAELKRVVG